MKIGILQTGYVPEPLVAKYGEYPSMFEKFLDGYGFTFETYIVVDGSFPKSVEECDAWLITGSAHGAYEAHAFIPPLEDFIREAYAKDIPQAGICFGHQIMAQALGGKVEKFDDGWGVGHTTYEMHGTQKQLVAMHQDQVVEKPEDAQVIACTDFCKNAGLAYKGKAISFQPHPEFTPEFMRELIAFKSGKGLPEDQASVAHAAVEDQNDAAEIGAQLAQFFVNAKAQRAA